jgi:hypothetical protein
MWIMTPSGFFSIVENLADRGQGTLTIRARDGADLDRLRLEMPELSPTILGEGTDYPARAAIGAALARFVEDDLDYSNFKSAVAARMGSSRAHVYSDVCHALLATERNA